MSKTKNLREIISMIKSENCDLILADVNHERLLA